MSVVPKRRCEEEVERAVYKRRSRVRVARVLCLAVVVGREERYIWRADEGVESPECWREETSSSGYILLLLIGRDRMSTITYLRY